MNRTLGDCPVCEKEIRPGEDAVVCPDCGTPYHRECYLSAGACVHADKHGAGYEYKAPKQKAGPGGYGAEEGDVPTVNCKNCGRTNGARNIFCEGCGSPLHGAAPEGQAKANPFGGMGGPMPGMGGMPFGQTAPLTGEIDGIQKQDWATYIGSSSSTYITRFTAQQLRGVKTGFSFSAFFFPQYYFAYRKMWGWAALFTAVTLLGFVPDVLAILYNSGNSFALGIGYDTLLTIARIGSAVQFIGMFLPGLFATYMYRVSAGKRIKKLQEQYAGDTAAYQQALGKKGGVSIPGVLIIFLVIFAIMSILQFGFGLDIVAYYMSVYMY